jgi:hypothetical protein
MAVNSILNIKSYIKEKPKIERGFIYNTSRGKFSL